MVAVVRLDKVAGVLAGLLLLSGGTIQTTSHSQSPPTSRPAGCARIEVMDEDAIDVSSVSPDGTYTVCIKEDREDRAGNRTTDVYLSRGGNTQRITSHKEIGGTRAFAWAPDSSAFGWNWTSGGASGTYYIDLFDMKSRRFLPVDKSAVADFLNRMRLACGDAKVDTNRFLLKWIDSQNILTAIETRVGGEDCRQPAPTDVYQVALPSGRIIKRLQGAEREAISREFDWL
jgi:hypothetical protein